MKTPEFIKEIVHSFNPRKLDKYTNRSFGHCVGYFTMILAFAFVIMMVCYAPQVGRLTGFVSEQMSKFDAINVSGSVDMNSAIHIPEKKPVLTIDMTGEDVKPTTQRVIITKDYVLYSLLKGTEKVGTKQLLEPTKNRPIVSQVLALFIIFILPSIVFYSFIALWIKYFLLILIIGTLTFLLLDLTQYRKKWVKTIKLACFAAAPVIAIEVISIPFNTDWLIPLFRIVGISIYVIGIVLLLLLTGLTVILTHYFKAKDGKNK
ncbi:DUF1189 family protein [Candidatus Woesearchaeota archaeon]|nr:DUF1189 family protein [Candidatus Woesearchaeota archaeon]MBW3005601.1 DUF1189 family protein [Candidatus Woesearchaeota archaeon]